MWAEHQGTPSLQPPNNRSWGLTRESFINGLPEINKMEIQGKTNIQPTKGALFSSSKKQILNLP